MRAQTKWRLVLWPPFLLLIIGLALVRPGGIEGLPVWAAWSIVGYVLLAAYLPAVLTVRSPRNEGEAAASRKRAAEYATLSRKLWMVTLYFHISALVAGLIVAVVLKNTFWFPYVLGAVSVNLILVVVLCVILFWDRPSVKSRS